MISCLGVPFCMYGGHSVFSWLQFYKLEVKNFDINAKLSLTGWFRAAAGAKTIEEFEQAIGLVQQQ